MAPITKGEIQTTGNSFQNNVPDDDNLLYTITSKRHNYYCTEWFGLTPRVSVGSRIIWSDYAMVRQRLNDSA